jgi:hypothetical protein
MQIEGLTPEQCDMLDFMWDELETEEDYLNWYDALDEGQQRQADLLQRLVIMASIDEDMLARDSFPEAKSLLDTFKK